MNISNLAHVVLNVHNNITSATKQNAVQNNQQNFNAATPSNQELLSNMSQPQLNNLYFQITQAKTNIMNNAQQNMFLRDALGLPKDWANLLKEFSTMENSQLAGMLKNLTTQGQSPVQEALLQLLNSNAKLNIQALAMQLKENSALMADKLFKFMGTVAMTPGNMAQLKEIMTIGASIANSANVNPQEFLRDIIQMYLPWLPLVPPKEEDLNEIETKFSKDKNKNAQTLFYIATNHLGYFKIEILSDEEPEIYISNISKTENDELREALCTDLKENIKKSSINAKLYFSRKIDDEEMKISDKQLFIVNSDNSIISLSLMHLLARVIFEFDEKQAQRFMKVEEANQQK